MGIFWVGISQIGIVRVGVILGGNFPGGSFPSTVNLSENIPTITETMTKIVH